MKQAHVDYTVNFKKLAFNFSTKKFYFQGRDIYHVAYNEEIIKELRDIYRKVEKHIYREEAESESEMLSEPDYSLPLKSNIDVTFSVDALIDHFSQLDISPFVVIGERAIFESARSIDASSFFDKEITTLSIYQNTYSKELMAAVKRINRFADFVVETDHLKIIRMGKIRIEVILKNDIGLNMDSPNEVVEFIRHSGLFYRSSSLGEGDRFGFVNRPYHLLYRLVLMLSRKSIMDKERRLVNLLVVEAILDEHLRNEFVKIVAKHSLEDYVMNALDIIHTESSLKLKTFLN